MKYSLGISNFLEDIPSLSQSIVFLYFFALITEEGFVSLLAVLWNAAFKWVYLPFLLCLLLLFSQLFVRPPPKTILPFCNSLFLGFLDHCLRYNVTDLHPRFFRQSVYQISSLEAIPLFHCIITKDLI